MYGLSQAGKVASDCLIPPQRGRPGSRPQYVDDFLVQYLSLEDLDHLQVTLRQYYQITVDIKTFISLYLCQNTLLQRPLPLNASARSPLTNGPPEYGASVQFPAPEDTSPPLDSTGIDRLQQIIGTSSSMPEQLTTPCNISSGPDTSNCPNNGCSHPTPLLCSYAFGCSSQVLQKRHEARHPQ
jgi:hypothetical protein